MRPVAIPETGVFIERRPIIGVAAVEEPPGDGAGYMDDLDTIRRCSSGSQWEYLAGIGKFMAMESPPDHPKVPTMAPLKSAQPNTPTVDPAKY
jgi:hypothetical protein